LLLVSFSPAAAAAPGVPLEELKYQVDVWWWPDAVRARLLLTRLGPGRYLAEISGEARGVLNFISGQRRDCFQTEMVFSQGRLRPVVYREESRRKGKYRLKEYRFHYDQGRLELWQWHEGQGLKLKWEAPLTETLYDPITAFYNYRLGVWGPLKEGETLKLSGIPYPRREDIEVRLGPETQEGRQVTVSLLNRAFEDQKGLVLVMFNPQGVPTQAWTRVLVFGKITGQLLPGSKPLTEKLGEL
jgi:hypothetical protein